MAKAGRPVNTEQVGITRGPFRMVRIPVAGVETLAEQVESRVREATHGRIRNLEVKEVEGGVELRGRTSSHYAKQLALHGALELVSAGHVSVEIAVERACGAQFVHSVGWVEPTKSA